MLSDELASNGADVSVTSPGWQKKSLDVGKGHNYKTCKGEKGHNYKTCKGAHANPNWKSKTRRSKKGVAANPSPQVEVPISQSAPQTQQEGDQAQAQAEPPAQVPQPLPPTRNAKLPFKPPAKVANGASSSRPFRVKQPVRRQTRKSPPPSTPPTPSQETLAAASASTQQKFRFMQTPGMNNKQ
ncbi:hypothetical protein PIB30_089653 [Stylosanthes scabra]|uniref:Uncharacterized protein n=1 Tax=Stylosanthes scabra TaxID=79078 RepID=A0ABU6QUD7_9FABA|nr:hypothetical protein [Stylosanthes scabra]